jgi:hypothetical protein
MTIDTCEMLDFNESIERPVTSAHNLVKRVFGTGTGEKY